MIEPVALGYRGEDAYPVYCNCGFIRDLFWMPLGASQEAVKAQRERECVRVKHICARVPESHSPKSRCVELEE